MLYIYRIQPQAMLCIPSKINILTLNENDTANDVRQSSSVPETAGTALCRSLKKLCSKPENSADCLVAMFYPYSNTIRSEMVKLATYITIGSCNPVNLVWTVHKSQSCGVTNYIAYTILILQNNNLIIPKNECVLNKLWCTVCKCTILQWCFPDILHTHVWS